MCAQVLSEMTSLPAGCAYVHMHISLSCDIFYIMLVLYGAYSIICFIVSIVLYSAYSFIFYIRFYVVLILPAIVYSLLRGSYSMPYFILFIAMFM